MSELRIVCPRCGAEGGWFVAEPSRRQCVCNSCRGMANVVGLGAGVVIMELEIDALGVRARRLGACKQCSLYDQTQHQCGDWLAHCGLGRGFHRFEVFDGSPEPESCPLAGVVVEEPFFVRAAQSRMTRRG